MSNQIIEVKQELNAVSLAVKQGDIVKAKKIISHLNQAHPTSELIIRASISLYSYLKEMQPLASFSEKLFNIHPADSAIASQSANLFAQLHDLEKAEKILLNHIESRDSPSDLKGIYFQIAIIYKHQFEFKKAIHYFEKAIEQNYQPLEECLLNLALSLVEVNKSLDAIERLEELLRLKPNDLLAKFNLASIQLSAGEKKLAIDLFDDVFRQDPTFVEAIIRRIYAVKITREDIELITKVKRRLRSLAISTIDKEGLNYALAKAYDDLADYPTAFDYARTANQLNRQRIGSFDFTEFNHFIDRTIAGCEQLFNSDCYSLSEYEPIFIVGHFRSGSTLIEQIVASHSHCVSLGEIDYFVRFFHRNALKYWSILENSEENEFKKLIEGYLNVTVNILSGSRIIDKRPENILYMGLIKRMFPKAKFILSSRNLLDNSISIYFQQLNDLAKYATSLSDFTEYDAGCARLIECWQSRFGQDILQVDYETLVAEPKSMTKKILEFLDLKWEENCLNFNTRKTFVRTASVSQVRNKIYRSSVGRGQNYLGYFSEEEKKCFINQNNDE